MLPKNNIHPEEPPSLKLPSLVAPENIGPICPPKGHVFHLPSIHFQVRLHVCFRECSDPRCLPNGQHVSHLVAQRQQPLSDLKMHHFSGWESYTQHKTG